MSEGALVTLVAAIIAAIGGIAGALIAHGNHATLAEVKHQTNSTLTALQAEIVSLRDELAQATEKVKRQ